MNLSSNPSSRLWQKRWFFPALWGAALLMTAVLAIGTYANALNGVPAATDFTLLYASALSFTQDAGLYQHFVYAPFLKQIVFLGTPQHPDGFRLMENLNPPVVSFLMLPFTCLEMRSAYYLWCGVQFTGGILLLWKILARHLPHHTAVKPAALLVFSAFFPVLANMLIGQLGLFLLILLGLSWLAFDQQQYRRAGFWLGMALLLKLFVGLIFIWLLLSRQWRALSWASMVWVLGMFAALLIFGIHDHQNWLKVVSAYNAGSLSWNASLEGVLERYFGSGLLLTYIDSPWLCWLLRALSWSLSAAAFIALNRWGNARLGFALCLPLMLYLAPIGWIYYFPILLITAILIWQESARLAQPQRLRAGVVSALFLASVPQMLASGDYFRPALWKPFYLDAEPAIIGNKLSLDYETAISWFVLPEVYTFALLLLAYLCWRTGYRVRSTQTGA